MTLKSESQLSIFVWTDDGLMKAYDVYETWTDKTGRHFELRAVHHTDKELIKAAFKKLSPDSVQKRFFTYKASLTDDEISSITDVDMVTSFTCVVTTSPDEAQAREGFTEQVAGIGQYMQANRRDEAEVAFLVCDEFQGRGLATRMLRELMKAGSENGIRSMVAITTATNHAMQHLLKHNVDNVKIVRDGSEMTLIIDVPANKDDHVVPPLSPLLTGALSTRTSKLLGRKATRLDTILHSFGEAPPGEDPS